MTLNLPAILTLSILTLSCGKNPPSTTDSTQVPAPLSAKLALYTHLHQTLPPPQTSDDNPASYSPANAHHFVHSQCDGSGFTALCHAAGLCPRPPTLAESTDQPGRWYRDAAHTCYPDHSASDISKDMLLMIMFDMYLSHDLAGLQRIRDYGKQHYWVMGEPLESVGRTYFPPTLQHTLAALINKLQDIQPVPIDPEFSLTADTPNDFFYSNTGSAAHLDVLHTLLRGFAYGYVTDSEKSTLNNQASRQPHNALFTYAASKYGDGNFESTFNTLADTRLYPDSRLPTSSDRCEEYLNQRDENLTPGGDWAPCPAEQLTHSGTDFGLVMRLLTL